MSRYFLPEGYQERLEPDGWTPPEQQWDPTVIHQPEVYPLAKKIADAEKIQLILDFGCGDKRKLRYLEPYKVIGFDKEVREHPDFVLYDLDSDREDFPIHPYCRTMVLMSDIIEHLTYPERMLHRVKQVADVFIVTSPDRDRIYSRPHLGPPDNRCHVREWNDYELRQFLKKELPSFSIDLCKYTRGSNNSDQMNTMVFVGKRR